MVKHSSVQHKHKSLTGSDTGVDAGAYSSSGCFGFCSGGDRPLEQRLVRQRRPQQPRRGARPQHALPTCAGRPFSPSCSVCSASTKFASDDWQAQCSLAPSGKDFQLLSRLGTLHDSNANSSAYTLLPEALRTAYLFHDEHMHDSASALLAFTWAVPAKKPLS